MLARLLQQQQSIATTIFEAEESINYRSQGGTLDLRTETGLAAVKEAGLWAEFQKRARYDGEALLLTDKNLVTWMRRHPRRNAQDTTKQLQEAPEIDRVELRRMLLESLRDGTVRWGHKLKSVEEGPSGLQLRFHNGLILDGFDLIVGCDGAFSKVRTLLSSTIPYYVGLAGWALDIHDAQDTDVGNFVNRGSVFAYSDGKSFSLQQLGDGSIHIGHYGTHPENYPALCGFSVTDPEEVKLALKKNLADWNPIFLDAVEKTTGDVSFRKLYQLPCGFRWQHKSGITLLGDAAHLMTPYAGIGVNTAFYDAMILSQEIASFLSSTREFSLDKHVQDYEEKMFTNAHKAMKLTEASMNDMLFTPGAPRTSIESWLLRHALGDLPRWAHGLFTVFVYVAFWIYKRFV